MSTRAFTYLLTLPKNIYFPIHFSVHWLFPVQWKTKLCRRQRRTWACPVRTQTEKNNCDYNKSPPRTVRTVLTNIEPYPLQEECRPVPSTGHCTLPIRLHSILRVRSSTCRAMLFLQSYICFAVEGKFLGLFPQFRTRLAIRFVLLLFFSGPDQRNTKS